MPALGGSLVRMTKGSRIGSSSFCVCETGVETPFASVGFDTIGRIVTLIDKATGREIVRSHGALNTFWLGEDIPEAWDNWDIDRDQCTASAWRAAN